ncbi:MAG: DUF4290 domain-containing protein [Bacteroidaceae bacterium]|jgi:hypothetical protein|nr:DUF4290 domain-containing protein [Bacteroidaceae bacterium]
MNQIQYNTEKSSLLMSEYGRIVQEMVEHCMTIEDRQERLKCATSIVAVMANLGQEKLANPEVQTKLWNHLALISRFQLDLDYPVEIIPQAEASMRPAPMSLPQANIRHKHYGRIVEQALQKLTEMPEGEERDALVQQTADRMKQNLFTWNPDVMSEEKVTHDIDVYTKGHNLSEALEGHQFATLHTLPTNILKRKKRK